MANDLVWDDKVHLLLGEVMYAHFYVYVDWTKADANLQTAFSVQVTVRAGGVQLWDTGVVPLKDGALVAAPAVPTLPSIDGKLDDWDCVSANGQHGSWTDANLLSFLISAITDVTLPISEILAALATLGPAGVAAASIIRLAMVFGPKKARITIGHTNVSIPVVHSGVGKVAQINHVSRPVGVPV